VRRKKKESRKSRRKDRETDKVVVGCQCSMPRATMTCDLLLF